MKLFFFRSIQWLAAIPSAMAGRHPHAHLLQAVRDKARRDMVLEWQSWVRIQHPALSDTDHHWSQLSVTDDDESLVQTQHAKPSMNNQAYPADDAFDPTVYDAPPAKRRKLDDDHSTNPCC